MANLTHIPCVRFSQNRNYGNYYAPIFYNKLSLKLKSMNIKCFKKAMRSILLENAFYSYKEFTKYDICLYLSH